MALDVVFDWSACIGEESCCYDVHVGDSSLSNTKTLTMPPLLSCDALVVVPADIVSSQKHLGFTFGIAQEGTQMNVTKLADGDGRQIIFAGWSYNLSVPCRRCKQPRTLPSLSLSPFCALILTCVLYR